MGFGAKPCNFTLNGPRQIDCVIIVKVGFLSVSKKLFRHRQNLGQQGYQSKYLISFGSMLVDFYKNSLFC